jgi:ABC-type nitrate/sulfonate/bicarbonate transport system ATPase subunit
MSGPTLTGKLKLLFSRPKEAEAEDLPEASRSGDDEPGPLALPLPPSDASDLGLPPRILEPASSEAKPPILQLVNVCKSFPLARGERLGAFENLNLTIQDHRAGEILVLLGPSGCGKSTLLGLIAGRLPCDSGKIMSFGREIAGPNPFSATVPQAYTCFPWLTALENVEFGLALQGMPRAARRERAMEYLRKVDLADRWDAVPKQLSGGMQQRVAIARTLAVRNPIVLMDEPFGALDAQTREEMQQMLLHLWSEEKNTIIFVTHDIPEAVLLADRIMVFPRRPVSALDEVVVPLPRPRAHHMIRNEDFIILCEQLRCRLKKSQAGHALSDQNEDVTASEATRGTP